VKPVDSHNGSDIARVADGVEPPTTAVRVWRWVTAAVALSQLAAPRIADALAGDFLPSGATNEATITPSGYAFSIWGLLCVLCVVTAAAIVRFGLGAARDIGALIERRWCSRLQRLAGGRPPNLVVGQRRCVRAMVPR
jgi:hypothetical protein